MLEYITGTVMENLFGGSLLGLYGEEVQFPGQDLS